MTSKQKSGVTDQVGRLKQELEDAQKLVKSLRTEVEQKEHIAALAVNKNQVTYNQRLMFCAVSFCITNFGAGLLYFHFKFSLLWATSKPDMDFTFTCSFNLWST